MKQRKTESKRFKEKKKKQNPQSRDLFRPFTLSGSEKTRKQEKTQEK